MANENDETDEPQMLGGWPMGLVGGEMRAMQREENLCGGCAHAPTCKVVASVDDEMLLVVSRCLSFLDAGIFEG